jgi:hypothetical protein
MTLPEWAAKGYKLSVIGINKRSALAELATQAKSSLITTNVPLSSTVLCPAYFIGNGASGATSYQTFIDLWEIAYKGNTMQTIFRRASGIKNF